MKTFKKLLILVLVSIVSISCSKDDNNEETIIGTWKYTSSSTNGAIDNASVCDLKTTVQFNETTGFEKIYYESAGECDFDPDSFTYVINDNILIVTFENSEIEFEILILNSTTLKLKIIEEGDTYIETYTRQ